MPKKQYLFFFFLLINAALFSQKTYQKIYFNNGNLKAEGWLESNKKSGYWKFYYSNGKVKKEGSFKDNLETKYWYFYRKSGNKKEQGHYIAGKQSKWWQYFDKGENLVHKCQLKNNQKNGYCLIYKDTKISKASKYKSGKKLKEWTDYSSFRKDNYLIDLR